MVNNGTGHLHTRLVGQVGVVNVKIGRLLNRLNIYPRRASYGASEFTLGVAYSVPQSKVVSCTKGYLVE